MRWKHLLVSMVVWSGFALAQTTIGLRPTSDGSVKQWNNNGGGACTSNTCYTQVNEASGSTNCSSSSYVQGSGVYNKAPATTGVVEQYGLTLTSIPNNSIIQSIVVHACEARGGTSNTAGILRIVLNSATTACGSNQSVTASYQDLSCTFSSLNVTKGSGTTLEIGNATTQTRAIWVDSIEAQVTYIQQAAGGVTGAFTTSPAVQATKHTQVQQVGNVAASTSFDPPCCIYTDYPLAASVHVSPAVEAHRTTNTNACCINESLTTQTVCSTCVSKFFDAASFTISPVVSVIKGFVKSTSVSAHVSPAVTTIRGLNKSVTASFHTSPAVTDVEYGSAPLSASINVATQVSAVAPGAKSAGVAVSFHFGTQLDEQALVSSGVSQLAHFDTVVTAKAGLSQSEAETIAFTVSVVAQVRQPKQKFVILVAH